MMRLSESIRQVFVSQKATIVFGLVFALLCVQGFAGRYSSSKISRTIYEIPEHDYPVLILDPEFDSAQRFTGIPAALGEIELIYAKFADPPSLVSTQEVEADTPPIPLSKQSLSNQNAGNDDSFQHVFADVLSELGIEIEPNSEPTVETAINSETTVEVPFIRKTPAGGDSNSSEDLKDIINDLIQNAETPSEQESAPTNDVASSETEVKNESPTAAQETAPLEADHETADAKNSESSPIPTVVKSSPTYSPQFVASNQRIRWLKQRIEQCLAVYRQQHVNTGDNGCWSTMHAILGVGQQARIQIHNRRGATENALQWLCENRPCARRQLFYLTDSGEIGVREGPGYQGHPAQFLAVAAQVQVPRSQTLMIEGQQFTLEDLIEAEKKSCQHGMELTFKLIGLMHYLQSDDQWQNSKGESWDIPTLIAAELSEQVNGAACGGTHRIMAVSHAALKRRFRGEPMTGQWWRAEKYMKDYQRYTLSLQNRNGSFSSDWFRKRSNNDEKDRQIQTTGHILEWLVFSLESKQLSDPRITNSVMFLTNLMIENRYYEWEQGPKWHAVRALDLYYRRAFGTELPNNIPLARQPTQRNQRMSIFSRIKGHLK